MGLDNVQDPWSLDRWLPVTRVVVRYKTNVLFLLYGRKAALVRCLPRLMTPRWQMHRKMIASLASDVMVVQQMLLNATTRTSCQCCSHGLTSSYNNMLPYNTMLTYNTMLLYNTTLPYNTTFLVARSHTLSPGVRVNTSDNSRPQVKRWVSTFDELTETATHLWRDSHIRLLCCS